MFSSIGQPSECYEALHHDVVWGLVSAANYVPSVSLLQEKGKNLLFCQSVKLNFLLVEMRKPVEGRWFSFNGLVKPQWSRNRLCEILEGLVWIQCSQAGWEWVGRFGKLIWFFCRLRINPLPPSLSYIKKENKWLAMFGFNIRYTLYDYMSRKLHSSQMKLRCEEDIK